jgi:hypothetical protein
MSKNKPITICVYFGLSKGEGEWPTLDVLTHKEKQDPRIFCDFTLDVDEGGSSVNPKIIKSCKILYDGASKLPGFEDEQDFYGIWISDEGIVANLRPIIEFELSQEVNPDEFVRLVWGSTYMMSPQNAEEPFYCEDWNGYTEVLSQERKEEWIEYLKTHGCYSGKTFKVKDLQKGIAANKLVDTKKLEGPSIQY